MLNLQAKVPNLPWFDDKALNFGFLIGFNVMDYKVVSKVPAEQGLGGLRYADVAQLNPGINIGMVTNFRINRYISLFVPSLALVSDNVICCLFLKWRGG